MSSLCGQGPVIKIYPYRGYTDRWIQRDRQTGKGGEISIQHVQILYFFWKEKVFQGKTKNNTIASYALYYSI